VLSVSILCVGLDAPEGVALQQLARVLPVPLGDEEGVVVPVHVDRRVLLWGEQDESKEL
jgi:hypothetical protein